MSGEKSLRLLGDEAAKHRLSWVSLHHIITLTVYFETPLLFSLTIFVAVTLCNNSEFIILHTFFWAQKGLKPVVTAIEYITWYRSCIVTGPLKKRLLFLLEGVWNIVYSKTSVIIWLYFGFYNNNVVIGVAFPLNKKGSYCCGCIGWLFCLFYVLFNQH